MHSARINRTSAIQAEASALLAGVRLAAFMRIQRIIIEGGNLSIIKAINRIWKTP